MSLKNAKEIIESNMTTKERTEELAKCVPAYAPFAYQSSYGKRQGLELFRLGYHTALNEVQ